jgi:two-component system NarL family sensor kinase
MVATSRTFRNVRSSVFAFLIPIALTVGLEKFYPPALRAVPGYLTLLAVAVIARFFGFIPAMAATLSFAAVHWIYLLPAAFPGRPLPFVIVRLVLFVFAATAIASISRQREEDVREAEEMYRSLVDSAPDGIGTTDEAGDIVFANPALARMVGARSPSELLGKKITDFTHPDFGDEARERMENLATGITTTPIEVKWVTLDGRIIDVETVGAPVHRQGEVFFQGFVRDLTERKNTAATLAETGRRMQALFSTAMDAILFADSAGHYVDANPAASALLGYSRDEIRAMSVGDFTLPDRKPAISAIWDDMKSGRGHRGEFVIVRKDGEVRDVEYATVSNVLPGLHGFFMHNITERKEAERSVRQFSARLLQLQDEERRRIARQLHDTTAQNLAALRLNLSTISRSPAASDSVVRESIDESVALTEQCIAEIRTLSYLLHPPMIEEAGLLPTLRWYAQGFEQRSGIRVVLDLPPKLDPLPLDLATTLFRIVQEALTNIQRHSGSAVAVIRMERQPEALHLEIEDVGHGMPEPLREHETLLLASGVGIAGMRERVREHGGEMQIQSQDTGTVVSVNLPMLEG